jgi:hypothetical protein
MSPDEMTKLFAEIPTPCTNCGKVCHVDMHQRMDRKWTCYGCGLVNRWAPASEKKP